MGLNQYLCNVNTIRYKMIDITESIKYIGVDDNDLDLFESQYIVPNGMAYNSYIILDEKIAVMDTVDKRKKNDWWCALEKELAGKKPDYLVVQHMEPDHAGVIAEFVEKYPESKIVATDKAIRMLPLFFEGVDFAERTIAVKENDTLSLGKHTLQFIMAPMVHWPEVLMSYESSQKILFSADGFGKFGAIANETDEWACEARRYYINICGKYGQQVQSVLKKAATLDIHTICPLHGPVLRGDLTPYLSLYHTWSSYEPETQGTLIAYASIHGNTAHAAKQLAEIIQQKGEKVVVSDLSRSDMAEVIEDAFRYPRLVLCASSYDGGVFPVMHDFLHHLQIKNYQKRRIGLLENGSWAPMAAKKMAEAFSEMKDIHVAEKSVTIKSALNDESLCAIKELAEEIVKA